MIQELLKYINSNFPNFGSNIHLRFELGEPFRNGSNRRLKQVNKRVVTIFEEIFHQSDVIYVCIKDWGNSEDPMFGNTTPDYIYKLLQGYKIEEETLFVLNEDEDDDGNRIKIKNEYQIKVLSGTISSFPYREILQGISHYEQGREPSIGQSIFSVSIDKDIVFNMYDDRGCIVYSKTKEQLKHLYVNYNDWLVNYWRGYFVSLFKEV
ncbi:DUF3885 domain-containing protein [Paenibacillus lactis]|uniref:DUF3885 domain-containing protein n=1 Tax=Paenibacillus lactis TaxID=228574 RepID=UPI001B1A6B8C|nr:DUF3885 domain-containing protein [Paenibacillus lactis]GIO91101.1 hypothetical protein J31TS3_23280 [Paenibacillus lactis]